MKKIGTKTFVNMENVNSANVFEVKGENPAEPKGFKICFVMKVGEPTYSELFKTKDEAEGALMNM